MDFDIDFKNDYALIWSVDLGIMDIYTVVNSSSLTQKERIRNSSTKKYSHLCGYNIAKRLFDDSNKYNSRSTIGEKKQVCDKKEKWVSLPPKENKTTDSYKKRLVTYGNASFASSMKGKLSAPTKSITDAIKKMSKDSQEKTEFIYIGEYLTNQTCSHCKAKSLANIIITDQSVFNMRIPTVSLGTQIPVQLAWFVFIYLQALLQDFIIIFIFIVGLSYASTRF